MLVLQRNINEVITIGDDIEVTLVWIKNSTTARIGITAPKHIAVDRKEVAEAKKRDGIHGTSK